MKNLLFLIGRVRSKERELLSRSDWQRFSESRDLSSWRSQLKDTVYAKASEAVTFESFEQSLVQHMQELRNDLFSIDHFPFEPLLFRKYDIHNMKLLLKTKHGHKDLRKFLVPLGMFPVAMLEGYILENEKEGLPLNYRVHIRRAEEAFSVANRSFAALDAYLDAVLYPELLECAHGLGADAEAFIRAQIDVANFKLWYFHEKEKKTQMPYIVGGNHSVRSFELSRGLSPVQVIARLFPRRSLAPDATDADIQREIDVQLSEDIYAYRYSSGTILPALVYFFAKEMEIKNLKTYYLMRSKNYAALSSQLRGMYV